MQNVLDQGRIHQHDRRQNRDESIDPDCHLLECKATLEAMQSLSVVQLESTHVAHDHHLGSSVLKFIADFGACVIEGNAKKLDPALFAFSLHLL